MTKGFKGLEATWQLYQIAKNVCLQKITNHLAEVCAKG